MLEVGQEIYYAGDMANCDGFGKITQRTESERWGDTFIIHMDDGRVKKGIPVNMIKTEYHGNHGVRFCTIEAYREWKQARIDAFMSRAAG